MRTKIKDEAYFKNFITCQPERIEEFIQFYEENKANWSDEDITSNYYSVFRISCHMFIAKYSAGYTIDEVTKSYIDTLNYMVRGWSKIGGYVHMVWMLSVGLLLKIDKSDFEKLVFLVNRDHLQDYVIDYLISFRFRDIKLSDTLEFAKPYKAVLETTEMPKTDAQARIRKYLEKEWYRGHKESYWYEDDKSEFDIYFGHWSFESAAVTAIMGLDDSSYRDNQYYPKDLVDYFRAAREG